MDVKTLYRFELFERVWKNYLKISSNLKSNSGKAHIMNNYIPTELKKSYEDRVAHLEKEVLFLTGMLEKN